MNLNRGQFLRAAKWLWLLAIAVLIAGLAAVYWTDISQQLAAVTWGRLVSSIAALIAGKMFLVLGARYAARSQGWHPDFLTVGAIVSLSQLGKYIPGSIWHFVGRAALYAAHGQRPATISKALILENVWQWSAALLLGSLFLLYAHYDSLSLPCNRLFAVSLAAAILAFIWWTLFQLCRRTGLSEAGSGIGAWAVLATQSAAWVCFGISMWVLFPAESGVHGLALTIGAVAIATLSGFLVPFAPGGLGVREFVLALGLSNLLSAEQAGIYAALSRLLWLVVEGGMALILYRWVYAPQTKAGFKG